MRFAISNCSARCVAAVALVLGSLVLDTPLFAEGCIRSTVSVRGGKVTSSLNTVQRAEKCRRGEISLSQLTALAAVQGPKGETGAVGPQGGPGPKGDTGPRGEAGPSLMRHTQNAESDWAISTLPTVVALISSTEYATYSGSYSGALVQPDDVGFLAVNVMARVANISGSGVSCALQTKLNDGAWFTRVQSIASSSELIMMTSFPSFTKGGQLSFRILCSTEVSTGTARGEMGVIAGKIG